MRGWVAISVTAFIVVCWVYAFWPRKDDDDE